ncbi:hypothetical protein [Streptomyces sp. NPDC051684]|uniref:hypothetical protein n=1 Tax=Streptomyces sp. NPDC051684 TaxID=3365670 RepID=UPI003794B8D3
MPGGWTLAFEGDSGIGFDAGVLSALAARGRTAFSACRDPDMKTGTIAHDGAVLGSIELSGGYFDGPSGSVDTAHPVIASPKPTSRGRGPGVTDGAATCLPK